MKLHFVLLIALVFANKKLAKKIDLDIDPEWFDKKDTSPEWLDKKDISELPKKPVPEDKKPLLDDTDDYGGIEKEYYRDDDEYHRITKDDKGKDASTTTPDKTAINIKADQDSDAGKTVDWHSSTKSYKLFDRTI